MSVLPSIVGTDWEPLGNRNPPWGLFVKLTATLGTRRGETCTLRWEDFDALGQRVLIRRAACVSHEVLTIKEPKSGRARTLHIPSAGFWRGLEDFRRPEGFLFRGGSGTRPVQRDGPRGGGEPVSCVPPR